VNDALFQKHISATKGFGGLGNHPFIILAQLTFVVATPDSSPAATGSGLEHHRITDPLGLLDGISQILEVAFGTGRDRHTSGNGTGAGFGLIPHGPNHLGTGSDKTDAAFSTDLRQQRVFREESIAWVQGITAGFNGEIHNAMRVEVARQGVRANAVRFIGFFDMQGVAVCFGVDGDRSDTQLFTGSGDPHCDLSPIRDENFLDHVTSTIGTRLNEDMEHIPIKDHFHANERLPLLAAPLLLGFVMALFFRTGTKSSYSKPQMLCSHPASQSSKS